MHKLIDAYRATPTDKNLARLRAYFDKHMMAACMLTAEETTELRSWGAL